MMRTLGKTWDGVPVPYLYAEDLDNATFDLFRKYAKRSGRMTDADLQDDNKGLLDKLRLFEGPYLKRAVASDISSGSGEVCNGCIRKNRLLPRNCRPDLSG